MACTGRCCSRHPTGFGSATDWASNLVGFDIELLRDGAVVDRGHAADVLDGPLSALRHLVGLLARDPVNSPLATGDIVITGTLTPPFRSWPARIGARRFTASSSAAGPVGSREPDVALSAGRANPQAAGLANPKLRAQLADLGGTVLPGSAADFGRLVADETEKWSKVVKFSGTKPA